MRLSCDQCASNGTTIRESCGRCHGTGKIERRQCHSCDREAVGWDATYACWHCAKCYQSVAVPSNVTAHA